MLVVDVVVFFLSVLALQDHVLGALLPDQHHAGHVQPVCSFILIYH